MRTYTAANGDTWDSIAFKVYGDEFALDRLCAANSRKYEQVLVFEGGEVLEIPTLEASSLDVIRAPWD